MGARNFRFLEYSRHARTENRNELSFFLFLKRLPRRNQNFDSNGHEREEERERERRSIY